MAHEKSAAVASQPAPHSWDLEHWPAHVWPGTTSKAKYFGRVFRNELLIAGAVARVGRQLVFFGSNYTKWLQTHRVKAAASGYNVPANRVEHRAP